MTPKKIVDRLELAIGANGRPVRLISAVEVELTSHFGFDAIRAAEHAETVSKPIVKIIEERAFVAERQGVSATLTILGSTGNMIAGACFVLPTDTDGVIAAKTGRLHSQSILDKIRSLTFSEFERFGKRILRELGAAEAHVTPHGNDQGIDFYGEFNFGQLHGLPLPFLRLAHDVRLLFAGQAKHYPHSSLGPNIVRELIGSVSLARTKTFSQDGLDIFRDLEIRPFSPVVALLFTTGEITAGASRLAAAAGIVAKNGRQLASFLADRSVGVRLENGVPVFDDQLFTNWLGP